MRKIAKKMVLWLLKGMAKYRLKKFRGSIIGVTGSVGKTSTKDAIFSVLNSQFKVKKNKGSMNSEFGLLLTILDIPSGYGSAAKWSWYLMKGFVHSLMRDHSEILLLELGVDKPKDMDFLTSVVKPDIAVLTSIAPVHMDDGQFETIEGILKEKIKLARAAKKVAIFNIDNSFLDQAYKEFDRKKRVSYGMSEDAQFRVSRVKSTLEGIQFYFHNKEEVYEMRAKVLGDYQVYVILPAIICGLRYGMSIEQIQTALDRYTLPPGRMSVIDGVNGSVILDSTYNSSPIAVKEALKVLGELGEGRRKIAILGNMNELGGKAQELHEMVGKFVPEYADMLITVGKEAEYMANKAIERGMSEEKVHIFKSTPEAIEFIKDKVQKDDLILVKGSQNRVRLERLVKGIMANPDNAKDLLVRQSKVWQAKL